MLVYAVSKDLHELLQDCRLTTVALLRELGRVVVVAVDASFMFVIAVLRTEDRGADRAGEVFDMIFPVERRDVRTSQCASTCET